MFCPAVFLDRDGVININHGYVHEPENFDFIEGIFDLAQHAHELSYKLVVVTNQAGIGRGYYSEADFHQLTQWMCQQFAQTGAPISQVYFSPFHPSAGLGIYLKDDFSRKPNPSMIFQAKKELDLDLSGSILTGKKPRDIQAGIAAGIVRNLQFAANSPMELEGVSYQKIATMRDALSHSIRLSHASGFQ